MSFSILFPTNQFTASSKTPEEIQRLTLPSDFSLAQTLSHIAVKGLPQQYPYLYKHLPSAHSKVLSFVCSKVPLEQAQNQHLIISSFKKLIQEKSNMLTSGQKEQMLQACLECLNNFQSTGNEQFVSVIELILKNHHDRARLLLKLETAALQLGKTNQLSISKVIAGRLVTIIGGFSGKVLKNQFVDILKKVFTATEVQARKIGISEIFPKLLQVLDLEFVQLHFQQRIFQAVWGQDEDFGVLALEVILRNASRFGQIEQSSRIIKLFVDSLTSKSEKVAVMATSLMGQSYQKLQHVILRNQIHCVRFWKSLVELSQSKNEKILNNMVYNLPGILTLAAQYHRVDPLCDIFIDLFYNPKTEKTVLASYFHQIVRLFPSKWSDLRQLFYWMLSELLEDNIHCQEAIKITNKIIVNLSKIQPIFMNENASAEGRLNRRQQKCFQSAFCNYLIKYLDLLVKNKVSAWIITLLSVIKNICPNFGSDFIQSTLLPKLYSLLRAKISGLEIIIQIIPILLSQQGNPLLTNTYISKISIQLMKSSRSYEREISISFFHHCTFHFSVETIQEYRLGQKYLSFNSDKNYKIKSFFIQNLPRMLYFLTRQERIQFSIIVNRLKKDNNYDTQQIMNSVKFIEDQLIKNDIFEKNKQLKESEREKLTTINGKKQSQSLARRPITLKEIRKEEILRKRLDSTKIKTKVVIKEIPKRKVTPLMLKTNSNMNCTKNI